MKAIFINILFLTIFVSCGNKSGTGDETVLVDDNNPSTPIYNVAPNNLTYPLNNYSFINQVTVTQEIYPTYYGSAVSNFSITPALPNGLYFSSLSGRIAGTPEGTSSSKIYTITAENDKGRTSTAITISVVDQFPFGLRYLVGETDSNGIGILNLQQDRSIVDLIPEYNDGIRGGAAIKNFSISPTVLPQGIFFDSNDGNIFGIPSDSFPETLYTITGHNDSSQTTTTQLKIKVSATLSQLASGNNHNCLLVGKIPRCWGDNSQGQLGNDNLGVDSGNLVNVFGNVGEVNKLYAGADYSCLINKNADAYCWGDNTGGQLGRGTSGDKPAPVMVDANFDGYGKVTDLYLNNIGSDISGSQYITCANLLFNNKQSCWGGNGIGWDFNLISHTLPLSVEENESNPIAFKISDLASSNFSRKTTIGHNFLCYIDSSQHQGKILCRGNDGTSQQKSVLGQAGGIILQSNTDPGPYTSPVLTWLNSTFGINEMGIPNLFPVAQTLKSPFNEGVIGLASGLRFSCGFNTNDEVFCWGENNMNQLGNSSGVAFSDIPSLVQGLPTSDAFVVDIKAGRNFACALIASKAYCWGSNSSGQLGRGTTGGSSNTPMPVQLPVGDLDGITSISLGAEHGCALTTSNELYCWGKNDQKQIRESAQSIFNTASKIQ